LSHINQQIDERNLIFRHKVHIGSPKREYLFWIHLIHTSCLPILLIFINIENKTFFL
jgi:hypothetical protein